LLLANAGFLALLLTISAPKNTIASTIRAPPASIGQLLDRNEDDEDEEVVGVAVGVAVTFSVLACCCAYTR
jgi:hypothetical protein